MPCWRRRRSGPQAGNHKDSESAAAIPCSVKTFPVRAKKFPVSSRREFFLQAVEFADRVGAKILQKAPESAKFSVNFPVRKQERWSGRPASAPSAPIASVAPARRQLRAVKSLPAARAATAFEFRCCRNRSCQPKSRSWPKNSPATPSPNWLNSPGGSPKRRSIFPVYG
jgi:hypothetical protein